MWPGKKLYRPRVLARIDGSRGGHNGSFGWWREGGEINPRMVRQMLMRRSAPQPAMRNTPTGGTAMGGETMSALYIIKTPSPESRGMRGVGRALTEYGDYHDEDG